MKIKDVYATYGREISAYSDKIRTLTKQKRTLETEIKDDPGNAETLKKDYDRLELSIKSLEETRDKYSAFTEKVRFLYKGIIINHNKKLSQPTLKRRFFKKKAAFFSWPGLGKEWC